MDVFSSKSPFLFMIIISCSALLLQSLEITKDNCIKNWTFLSDCFFNISFQPSLTEKLECSLTFPTKTSNTVRFSSDRFVLQRQVEHMCPHFNIRIKTQDRKLKQLFTTCGGTVNPVSATFHNFTLAYIHYENEGLIDNSTIIMMQLWLETGKLCDELNSKTFKYHQPLIIILSVVGCVMSIIVCVVIVYRYCFKGNERKAPNYPLPEGSIPFCESVDGDNGKDRDLGDDSRDKNYWYRHIFGGLMLKMFDERDRRCEYSKSCPTNNFSDSFLNISFSVSSE